MPLPKRRHSSTRRDKRRKNIRLDKIIFTSDNKTGNFCRLHKAHWEENNLIYKGEKIFSKPVKS